MSRAASSRHARSPPGRTEAMAAKSSACSGKPGSAKNSGKVAGWQIAGLREKVTGAMICRMLSVDPEYRATRRAARDHDSSYWVTNGCEHLETVHGGNKHCYYVQCCRCRDSVEWYSIERPAVVRAKAMQDALMAMYDSRTTISEVPALEGFLMVAKAFSQKMAEEKKQVDEELKVVGSRGGHCLFCQGRPAYDRINGESDKGYQCNACWQSRDCNNKKMEENRATADSADGADGTNKYTNIEPK